MVFLPTFLKMMHKSAIQSLPFLLFLVHNASLQLLPKAEATKEQRLEAVSRKALLGGLSE
jgi:hypothetical protein